MQSKIGKAEAILKAEKFPSKPIYEENTLLCSYMEQWIVHNHSLLILNLTLCKKDCI